MPNSIITLLPPDVSKRRLSAPGASPAVPVPASAVPKFNAPQHLVPDNFWSNLKQFLTERPVKVVERPGAPLLAMRLAAVSVKTSRNF